jgi:hypothetical protein
VHIQAAVSVRIDGRELWTPIVCSGRRMVDDVIRLLFAATWAVTWSTRHGIRISMRDTSTMLDGKCIAKFLKDIKPSSLLSIRFANMF